MMKPLSTTLASALLLISLCHVHGQTPDAKTTQYLINKYECNSCHSQGKAMCAPSFQEIADKYKSKTDAVNYLSAIIRNGNKGNWPQVSKGIPMPPYSGRISDEQIKKISEYIMGK